MTAAQRIIGIAADMRYAIVDDLYFKSANRFAEMAGPADCSFVS